MSAGAGRFTAPDGARLAYRDEGAGPPVLCLAGLTRSAEDFRYLVPHLLAAGRRVIRMDYRGRGASDWTGAESYTIPRESADALALLDHLGVARATVIGTSRGGLIGMSMAALARDRLAGLVLNDIGPVIERAGLDRIAQYVGRNPAARSHAEAAEALARTMAGFDDVPPGRWLEEARTHFTETPEGLVITYDPALRAAFLAAYEAEAPDLWPLFDMLDGVPLAAIRGANSDLMSPGTLAEMRRRRADMIAAEIPGRGHVPFLDEAESLAVIHALLERTA
jgi:pimeloyl-ACP methyl ester carboxylesterase